MVDAETRFKPNSKLDRPRIQPMRKRIRSMQPYPIMWPSREQSLPPPRSCIVCRPPPRSLIIRLLAFSSGVPFPFLPLFFFLCRLQLIRSRPSDVYASSPHHHPFRLRCRLLSKIFSPRQSQVRLLFSFSFLSIYLIPPFLGWWMVLSISIVVFFFSVFFGLFCWFFCGFSLLCP